MALCSEEFMLTPWGVTYPRKWSQRRKDPIKQFKVHTYVVLKTPHTSQFDFKVPWIARLPLLFAPGVYLRLQHCASRQSSCLSSGWDPETRRSFLRDLSWRQILKMPYKCQQPSNWIVLARTVLIYKYSKKRTLYSFFYYYLSH